MRQFKIQGYFDIDDQDFLYWSDEDGWVDFDSADTYNADELYGMYLPLETKGIAILDETNVSSLPEAFDKLKEYANA